MLLNEIFASPDIINLHAKDITQAAMSPVTLYRGMHSMARVQIGDSRLFNIRTDRLLLDSTPLSGYIFDKIMEANGWPYRKANTCSITRSLYQTTPFGVPCRVFPFNGMQFVYSTAPAYKDLATYTGDLICEIGEHAIADRVIPNRNTLDVIELSSLLTPQMNYVDQYLAKNMQQISAAYQLKQTTKINELKQSNGGEILMYGTQYIATRIR